MRRGPSSVARGTLKPALQPGAHVDDLLVEIARDVAHPGDVAAILRAHRRADRESR